MAFSTIIDDTRRMNAKMISMGQSTDIQKMPRPKPGSQIAQKQAMFTPSGSDVEKMLYPKNFKPRAYQAEGPEQKETSTEESKSQEIVEEVMQEQKTPAVIIGDDEEMEEPTQVETKPEATAKPFPRNAWESCRHYKAQGERAFCTEYLGWCAKDKCARPKY